MAAVTSITILPVTEGNPVVKEEKVSPELVDLKNLFFDVAYKIVGFPGFNRIEPNAKFPVCFIAQVVPPLLVLYIPELVAHHKI